MNARTPSALPGTKFQTFVGKCVAPTLVVLVVFAFYLVKPDNLQTSDPVWAPDGSWLAFTAADHESADIWVIRPDASEHKSLMRND